MKLNIRLLGITLLLLCISTGISTAQCIADKPITLQDGSTSIDLCSSQRILLKPGSNAGLYVFIITDADGIIESIQSKRIVDLSTLTPGSKRIYGASWFGVLLDPIGESIEEAVLADFCYELSSNFIDINLAGGALGSLTPENPTSCLLEEGATLTAQHDDVEVADGFELLYVLTSGADLVIEAVNETPSFTVEEPGQYTIHSLLYNPSTLDLSIVEFGTTTGFDVNSLLVQGGGDICALLDVAGAAFTVDRPDAGSLTAVNAGICFAGDPVELMAEIASEPVIPDGYALLYVLTSGEELVITQVGTDPSFTVEDAGIYTIHSLVYDPTTLDLGIVEFGTTTGVDVNGLLTQGGGSICGSLDVAGAPFNVSAPMAGMLEPTEAGSVCLPENGATVSASFTEDPVIPAGFELLFVLTSGESLIIEQVAPEAEFAVTEAGTYTIHSLVYDPNTLDLSIVEPGVTTGVDVNNLLVQGGGSICGSLLVAGAPFQVSNPDAGTLIAGAIADCFSGAGPYELVAEVDAAPVIPAGYEQIYVLTSGEDLVIQAVSATPSFEVAEAGIYTIHSLVYNPATLDLGIVEIGTTTGFDVNGLLVQGGGTICASLDVAGAGFDVVAPDAGSLTGGTSFECVTSDSILLEANIGSDPSVPTGYQVLYVLTRGTGLIIEQVGASPAFSVTEAGLYTIHTLVYNPLTLDLSIVVPGVTTGFDVNSLLVQGGGEICASLDVAGTAYFIGPDAGTLTGGGQICVADSTTQLTATIDEAAVVPDNYEVLYVLTQDDELTIIDVASDPTFSVNMGGVYTIHTLVYNPMTLDLGIVEFGVTTGVDVNGLLVQGGGEICASLDVAGARFELANPQAGTLTATGEVSCYTGDTVVISATANGDTIIPGRYELLYVLTSGSDLVIEAVSETPSFTVTAAGNYTIHGLVYDPGTLDLGIVEFGTTTGFDVNGLLTQGGGSICASLDVAGAPFTVGPDAGSLTAAGLEGCSDLFTLTAAQDRMTVVPEGYEILYVLTSGSDLVIQQVGAEPVFTVDTTGLFTIHTLVYDPETLDLTIVEPGVTTGVDVNGLLIQGGGDICASLDVAGAAFEVSGPSAGTLMADTSFVCFDPAGTTLTANIATDPVIPAGYSSLYVLTSGMDLVIEQVGTEPIFMVNAGGMYTIHTLVYDSTTLDLSIVEPGVTTGVDVNGLLVQGGGDICASLDVAGAPFMVGPDAGSLTAAGLEGCSDLFTLTAAQDRMTVAPEGYEILYVLTSGSDLVIQQVGAEPVFTVDTTGLFTIHTLVYDPMTLDLTIVEPGVTTGVDVNGLLIQGGGDICASLDVAGAAFEVSGPSAGTLMADTSFVCFDPAGTTLTANIATDPVIPAGYSSLYVLTSGMDLVIEQVGADPSFMVNAGGMYTIHTLVYDSTTLDLSIVEPGVTTGVDVNGLLVQGGGDICASLDVAGAPIMVGPDAGTLVALNPAPVVPANGTVVLEAEIVVDPVVPSGYSVLYVLTSGEALVIENVGAAPTFEIAEAGRYTIHTLVYDTTTLDLGIVEIGTTTGVDVNGLLVQGGGSICAALDVAGAVFEAETGMGDANTSLINAWFDGEVLQIQILSKTNQEIPIQVTYLNGHTIHMNRMPIQKGENQLQVPIAMENPAGFYFARIGNEVIKFTKQW